MATLAAIREALRVRLDTIADLQASAYLLSNPTPPCAMVGGPDSIDWRVEFGGTPTWTIPILVYTGMASDVGAQKKLDTFLAPTGATSVRAVIEAAPTLGGVVSSVAVTETTGYRQFLMQDGQTILLGAEFMVEVYD